MISKTKINQRMRNKTNSLLAETIFLAKKNKLVELAGALSVPSRKQVSINLGKLDSTKSDSVIVPGKVLSDGEIEKRLKVYAVSFSAKAKEKLKKAGCECKLISDSLKKGEKLNGEIIYGKNNN